MPAWIHSRAEHILAKNPSMPKGQAFAIATQQSHAVGKSPKGYGTSSGRATAKAKYPTPGDDRKTANPGRLTSPIMEKKALVERLARLALTDVPGTPRLVMRQRSPEELAGVQEGISGAVGKLKEPVRTRAHALAGRLASPGRLRGALTGAADLAIDHPEIVPMQALPIPGLTPAYLGLKKGLERAIDRFAPMAAAKTAEGAPTRGGFAMASDIPPFRAPNLRTGIQKAGDMLPDGITYNAGDFKPVKFTKRGGAALTPAGRLAQTNAVGMPKVTAPAGPSIADIAKPKGPGFGTGIAGAFKGSIGGTVSPGYK